MSTNEDKKYPDERVLEAGTATVLDRKNLQAGKEEGVIELTILLAEGFEVPENADAFSLGIPAFLTEEQKDFLKDHLNGDLDWDLLGPSGGQPGPNYSNVTPEFLERLRDKAIEKLATLDTESDEYRALTEKLACLVAITGGEFVRIGRDGEKVTVKVEPNAELLEILQANYDVWAMLKLFPGIVSGQDLFETLEPEHGNKTICITDITTDSETGQSIATIHVCADSHTGYRNLFGEPEEEREGLMIGMLSSALRTLRSGRRFLVNLSSKSSKDLPKDLSDKKVWLIAQGGAMGRHYMYLDKIKERRENNDYIGPVTVFLSFGNADEVYDLSVLLSKLDPEDKLVIALSKATEAEIVALNKQMNREGMAVRYVSGRVQEALEQEAEAQELDRCNPPVSITAGGQRYCEGNGSVTAKLEELFGQGDHIIVTRAPDRRKERQGEKYKGLDPNDALALVRKVQELLKRTADFIRMRQDGARVTEDPNYVHEGRFSFDLDAEREARITVTVEPQPDQGDVYWEGLANQRC